MLRLLILCLVLSATVTSEDIENEASGGDGDDEDEVNEKEIMVANSAPETKAEVVLVEGAEKAAGKAEDDNGLVTAVIISAVCVGALAVVGLVAYILVKRRMESRRQGVYTVPVAQSEKPAI